MPIGEANSIIPEEPISAKYKDKPTLKLSSAIHQEEDSTLKFAEAELGYIQDFSGGIRKHTDESI